LLRTKGVFNMNLFHVTAALIAVIPVSSYLSSNIGRGSVGQQIGWARNCAIITKKPLFSSLDDEIKSDAFNLLSTSSSDTKKAGGAPRNQNYDIFLAELVFSPNDPRLDIAENADRAFDEDFLSWLANKVERSIDAEEKVALRDLLEMILEVKKKIDISKMAEDRMAKEKEEELERMRKEAEELAASNAPLSDAEVLLKATNIRVSASESEEEKVEEKKKTFYETEISPEIRMSYEGLLQKLLPPYNPGETVATVVYNLYDQCDAQLVKIINDLSDNGDADSKVVQETIALEQQNRIGIATEALKEVLALREPPRMEGAIVKMAREGRIDEPFLLLLEANADQARKAGANGPADLMKRLHARAQEEKDKHTASKEIKLLRKLLRAEDSEARLVLLEEAFEPRDALIVAGTMENAMKAADGEAPEQKKPEPDVSPPDFINACKALLINFGNLSDQSGDVASKIKEIASEAEIIATRIYGTGMTLEEQQDKAWSEQTTSIFELEQMEIQAEQLGDVAPWTNPNDDDILPGFDSDGRMKVGGG